mmetsp:Transcript_29045/g.33460  ORF Transcript_29045/g.33460 Transcript_29045/m.33460 type:complete len:115 (+) Transcript_29045:163-507(+)
MTHLTMFDHKAQVNGVIYTRFLAFVGFSDFFQIVSYANLAEWIKLQFSASSIKYVKVLTLAAPTYLRMYLLSVLKFVNRQTSYLHEIRKDSGLDVLRELQIAHYIPADYGDYCF